jgi:hypothetical protein
MSALCGIPIIPTLLYGFAAVYFCHTAKAKTTGNRSRKSAKSFIELKETRIEPE